MTEPTAHLVNGQFLEAQPSVVRRVPGDLRVRRERQSRQPSFFRPGGGGVEKRPAQALAGVAGVHGHLFYVSIAVDDGGQSLKRIQRCLFGPWIIVAEGSAWVPHGPG